MLLSSLSAPLPVFQSKVADCLIKLGNQAANKDSNSYDKSFSNFSLDNFSVLGQQTYLSHIRPICVNRHYLYKNIPTQEHLTNEQKQNKYFSQLQKLIVQQRKIRPSLKIFEQLEEEKAQVKQPVQAKKVSKKGSKAYQNGTKDRDEQFKKKSINQKFFLDLEQVLGAQVKDVLQVQFGLSKKIIEIKLMTLFYIRWYIQHNFPQQRISYEDVYQYISALIKIIKKYQKYVGQKYQLKPIQQQIQQKCMVSPTLILDLKLLLIYMVKKYKFNNTKILFDYPRLSYDNKYNKFFPTFNIKPYPSQIQLLNYIRNAIDLQKGTIKDSKIIIYNTMVGAGKTSFVLTLNKFITTLNQEKQQKQRLKILYACQLQSVNIQLSRLAYQKLGSVAYAREKSIKLGKKQVKITEIKEKFNQNKQDKSMITDLIVTDWTSAYNLLDQHELSEQQSLAIQQYERQTNKTIQVNFLQPENTILFVDEPTLSCDSTNSYLTNQLFQIMAHRPPKIIILASATMPHTEQILKTFDMIRKVRPNLQVEQVKSKQFQIGCQFYTFGQKIFYPHSGVQNKEQLLNVIARINQNPFLMRFYTGTTLFSLIKVLKNKGIKIQDNLDLKGYSTNITHRDFPEVTNKILTTLSKQNEKLIQQICSLENLEQKIDIQQQQSSDQQFFNSLSIASKIPKKSSNTSENKQIIFDKIAKKYAYKYLGGCLIATADPISFSLKHFKGLVKDLPSMKKLRQHYTQNKYDAQEQLIFIKGQGEQEKKIEQKNKVKSIFPSSLKVNTIFHYNYYKPVREQLSEQKEKLNRSKILISVPIQTMHEFLEGQVDETILKLLMCGIGIYAEEGLSKKYLQKVEQLASLNRLAFIISDKSLCFGVNFPISNVIILDDLATNLSWNQIFQLIGRAGRVGRSWTAKCFIQEKTQKRFFQYIKGDNTNVGQQGHIFSQLGIYYINNPELKLRTLKTEVIQSTKIVNLYHNPTAIQIILKDINPPQKQNYKIQNISLFVKNNKKQVFSSKTQVKARKQSSKYLNYYEFPSSPPIIQDIPTIMNQQNIQILDIQSYFKNQNKFIESIINNARLRVLSSYFSQQDIKNMKFINTFDSQNVEKYYSNSTSTLCLFIEYEGDKLSNPEQIKYKEQRSYKFNQITVNKRDVAPKLTQKMIARLLLLTNASKNLLPLIYQNPNQILLENIKIIRQSLDFIKRKKNLQCYYQFLNAYNKQIEKDITQIIKNVQNKDSLLYLQEFKTILLTGKYLDLQKLSDQMFAIDKNVRDVQCIVKQIQQSNQNIQQIQDQFDQDEDTPSEKSQQIANEEDKINSQQQYQVKQKQQNFEKVQNGGQKQQNDKINTEQDMCKKQDQIYQQKQQKQTKLKSQKQVEFIEDKQQYKVEQQQYYDDNENEQEYNNYDNQQDGAARDYEEEQQNIEKYTK